RPRLRPGVLPMRAPPFRRPQPSSGASRLSIRQRGYAHVPLVPDSPEGEQAAVGGGTSSPEGQCLGGAIRDFRPRLGPFGGAMMSGVWRTGKACRTAVAPAGGANGVVKT